MQDILDTGVGLFIPSAEDIDTCVHKHKSYLKFKEASVKVPENIVINNEVDLKEAFDKLSDAKGDIWIRSLDVGGGGKGSLATSNYEFAKNWIDHYEGWGSFAAAEMLSPNSVTFLTIWNEGEILVGQGRSRHGWSGRSMSGVTGVTKVGKINNDPEVVKIAIDSINAISEKPHGIWAVDMSYDRDGIPNPTEINIGRF